MSKVITFSRTFPKYHPRAGQPTNFKEKLLTSLYLMKRISHDQAVAFNLIDHEDRIIHAPKSTTVRAGFRWKENEYFSPREWSGKSYVSKQNKLFEDLRIETIYALDFYPGDGFYFCGNRVEIDKTFIPINDGLSSLDFFHWFDKSVPFHGQILSIKKDIHRELVDKLYDANAELLF
jgi:hypothetical protein